MTVIITLTTAGADTGPFNLFSDADGYTSAFALGVSKIALEAGYPSDLVPDGTTTIRVQSVNSLCNNFILLPTGITTTTTSSTSTTTSTTTLCVSCCDVTIGAQIWTTCNLDVSTYRDGTPIPEVTDPTAWAALTTGAWCYYNNNSANEATYGKLYNWYAINDTIHGGLAPASYHIPSDVELTSLTTFLGGESLAGGAMKETGLINWFTPNTGATNSSGFTGLPGGDRNFDGSFSGMGYYGFYWSSSEFDTTSAIVRSMNYNNDNINRNYVDKTRGFSVRLIKD